jgi:hypothetical protein
MLCHVALIRPSVSEERSNSILFPSSPVPVTLMMEALRSSETSVLTRATRHNISEDAILWLNDVYNTYNSRILCTMGSVNTFLTLFMYKFPFLDSVKTEAFGTKYTSRVFLQIWYLFTHPKSNISTYTNCLSYSIFTCVYVVNSGRLGLIAGGDYQHSHPRVRLPRTTADHTVMF